MRNRRIATRLAAVAALPGLALVGPLAHAAGAATPVTAAATPQYKGCPSPPGPPTFKSSSVKEAVLGSPGADSWTWLDNTSGDEAYLSRSVTTSGTVSYQVSVGGSVSLTNTDGLNLDIIQASVSEEISLNFGASITKSYEDSATDTFGVDVPGHEYGEVGFANQYGVVVGTYFQPNTDPAEDCGKTYTDVLAEYPLNAPPGGITAVTKTQPTKAPWPMAPTS
jgi:hypothetical protein